MCSRSALRTEFAQDVRKGLRLEQKSIPAKYFYDAAGSELFEEITRQPEYYLTRAEAAILEARAREIRRALGGELSLVELGSGSSVKTTILLESILTDQRRLYYLPIDISSRMLEETAERLDSRYPRLSVVAIPSDYARGLHEANRILEETSGAARKLVLFLGSSVGNLEPEEAQAFFTRIRETLSRDDGLLVGFDLQKDTDVLNAAYNDRAGVTARFNLNLLERINRQLGGEFDLSLWEHRAFYRAERGRVEMHLLSRSDQTVVIRELEERFSFRRGETIHTENSYKYTRSQIQRYAEVSRFRVRELFTDEKEWFALALFTPV